MSFLKHFTKKGRFFLLVSLFFRGPERGQRAVEGTETRGGNYRAIEGARGLKRRQRTVERTEVLRGDRAS